MQIALHKAVRQGMVKQDKKNRYFLVPPVIQFMETCLPRSSVRMAVGTEVQSTETNQTKNFLERVASILDTRPPRCKKCGNSKCTCRIGIVCASPTVCKKCKIKAKPKVAARREKAANVRMSAKYFNKMNTCTYAKIVRCPECLRILFMKRT